MGGQRCPNCIKGILIRKGKRTKVRCTSCGYWKFGSPNASSRGVLVGAIPVENPEIHPDPEVEKDMRKEKKEETIVEEISKIEEERPKLYQKDPDYVRKKALHDQMIQAQRREYSIQKMLRDMRRRNKYGKLGPTVIIDGEVFDLKTGERIYDRQEGPAQAEKVE